MKCIAQKPPIRAPTGNTGSGPHRLRRGKGSLAPYLDDAAVVGVLVDDAMNAYTRDSAAALYLRRVKCVVMKGVIDASGVEHAAYLTHVYPGLSTMTGPRLHRACTHNGHVNQRKCHRARYKPLCTEYVSWRGVGDRLAQRSLTLTQPNAVAA